MQCTRFLGNSSSSRRTAADAIMCDSSTKSNLTNDRLRTPSYMMTLHATFNTLKAAVAIATRSRRPRPTSHACTRPDCTSRTYVRGLHRACGRSSIVPWIATSGMAGHAGHGSEPAPPPGTRPSHATDAIMTLACATAKPPPIDTTLPRRLPCCCCWWCLC